MQTLYYKAIDQNGNKIVGEIEADSIEAANNLLNSRGYIPMKVTGSKRRIQNQNSLLQGLNYILTPIKSAELILFTKQFQTMLRVGIPMLKILNVLEKQTENHRLKIIIRKMGQDVKEGVSLNDAFGKYPNVFSSLYRSMILAGEKSGSLPEVLERMIYILEHEYKIKQDIKSALQYPVIVIFFLGVAFFVLLTFVIPKFIKIFMSAGLELPLPTIICMFMYRTLVGYWHIIAAGVILLIVLLTLYLRTEQGKLLRDSFLLRIPILGGLLIKSAMSRFASIFSILQSSGVPVLESLQILSGTIGNVAINREFIKIADKLAEGRGIATPLQSAKYFPPMIVNMVAIGEESGKLDELLIEASFHYDAEVEFTMAKFSESIGPILTVGLAFVVGFFAIAIFLPIWDLTKLVK